MERRTWLVHWCVCTSACVARICAAVNRRSWEINWDGEETRRRKVHRWPCTGQEVDSDETDNSATHQPRAPASAALITATHCWWPPYYPLSLPECPSIRRCQRLFVELESAIISSQYLSVCLSVCLSRCVWQFVQPVQNYWRKSSQLIIEQQSDLCSSCIDQH